MKHKRPLFISTIFLAAVACQQQDSDDRADAENPGASANPQQPVAAPDITAAFADPFAYCTALGTIDAPDVRYTGPQSPAAIDTGLQQAAGDAGTAMSTPAGLPVTPAAVLSPSSAAPAMPRCRLFAAKIPTRSAYRRASPARPRLTNGSVTVPNPSSRRELSRPTGRGSERTCGTGSSGHNQRRKHSRNRKHRRNRIPGRRAMREPALATTGSNPVCRRCPVCTAGGACCR